MQKGNPDVDSETRGDRSHHPSSVYILLGEGERKVAIRDKGGPIMRGDRGFCEDDGAGDHSGTDSNSRRSEGD